MARQQLLGRDAPIDVNAETTAGSSTASLARLNGRTVKSARRQTHLAIA